MFLGILYKAWRSTKATKWFACTYLALAIAVLAIIILLKSHGALREAENLVSDFHVKYLSGLSNISDRLAIVAVTPEDYRNLFRSESPLDPEVIRAVLEKIAKGGPRVIAVDIETSDERFGRLASLTLPTTVWARTAETNEQGLLSPRLFLGGAGNSETHFGGLAILFDDAHDRVTRRYRRMIPSVEGELPGFPFATVKAYDESLARNLKASPELLTIRYTKAERREFPAGLILHPAFDWKGQIEGKIVLFGGRYDRDVHHTPLGPKQGVDILADVIDTELRGGGFSSPSGSSIFLFGFFALFLVPSLILGKGKLVGSLVILSLIPIVALMLAFLAPDLSLAVWLYFSAILFAFLVLGLFGIWLFQLKVFVEDGVHKQLTDDKDNPTAST